MSASQNKEAGFQKRVVGLQREGGQTCGITPGSSGRPSHTMPEFPNPGPQCWPHPPQVNRGVIFSQVREGVSVHQVRAVVSALGRHADAVASGADLADRVIDSITARFAVLVRPRRKSTCSVHPGSARSSSACRWRNLRRSASNELVTGKRNTTSRGSAASRDPA